MLAEHSRDVVSLTQLIFLFSVVARRDSLEMFCHEKLRSRSLPGKLSEVWTMVSDCGFTRLFFSARKKLRIKSRKSFPASSEKSWKILKLFSSLIAPDAYSPKLNFIFNCAFEKLLHLILPTSKPDHNSHATEFRSIKCRLFYGRAVRQHRTCATVGATLILTALTCSLMNR